MARIIGVDLPRDKRIEAALQYIYGIGPTRARQVLAATGIDPDLRVKELTDEQASMLAHARGLMFWRTKHKFCGVCGAATAPRSAGNARASSSGRTGNSR